MRPSPEFKVAETAVGLEISGEIGPCSKEQLRITVEARSLRIRTAFDDRTLFEEVLELPVGYDLSRASADCRHGVLRITVPREFRWN